MVEWILENQDARRERTELEIKDHRGRLYEIRKKRSRGAPVGNQNRKNQLAHSEPIDFSDKSTSKKLASQFGVGHATIKRDAQFSRAVQKVAQASENPTEARQVLLRDNKVTAKDTVKLGAIASKTLRQVGKSFISRS